MKIRTLFAVGLLMATALYAAPEDALKDAAEAGDPAAIEAALRKKPNVNATFEGTRETPLFYVLSKNSVSDGKKLASVKLLIAAGADVNARAFSDEFTPLHRHISSFSDKTDEDLQIIEALVSAGTDINAVSKEGKTAMSIAIETPYVNVMKKLIDLGVELNPVLGEGKNYVHKTAQLDMEKKDVGKALELLIAAGVDFDTPDDAGRTPLHYAAESGNEPAIRALLKHKPRIDRKDNGGKTPVDLALKKKGIAETPGYEQKLAALIRNAVKKPKLFEIGEVFSASASQVDIVGKGIAKVKPGQKLIVKTARGDYTLIAGENMHTKLKAKASPAAAARLTKGDKVYIR